MFDNIDLVVSIKRLSIAFVPLMFGIIVHEVAHGWVASRLGDMTAKYSGRLTLNPLPHIDPMGLLAFVVTSLSSPFVFGWAKPVPVDYRYLKNPLRDMMFISAAGPLSNFIIALMFGFLLKFFLIFFPIVEWHDNNTWTFFSKMLAMGIGINCSLAWINLIPIPPLDGSKILTGILPKSMVLPYMNLERYGFVILILLLVTGILGKILAPLVGFSLDLILTVIGLI